MGRRFGIEPLIHFSILEQPAAASDCHAPVGLAASSAPVGVRQPLLVSKMSRWHSGNQVHHEGEHKMRKFACVAAVMSAALVGCTPTTSPTPTTQSPTSSTTATVTNPSRVELVGTGSWTPLADASVDVVGAEGTVIDADFWSSTACSGSGRRYTRVLLDGVELASAPLTVLPATGGVTEQSSSVRASRSVSTGAHRITVETRIDSGTSCVVVPGYWHLRVDTLR
jgi:hypothetical protein